MQSMSTGSDVGEVSFDDLSPIAADSKDVLRGVVVGDVTAVVGDVSVVGVEIGFLFRVTEA